MASDKKGDDMNRFAIAAVLATALGTTAISSAHAQESATLKKIKDTGSITLGHRESSIPFSYYDDKQQVIGYSHELMLKVVDSRQGRAEAGQDRTQADAGHLGQTASR
jgi:ABC-type amino acid transport substrate-binding protein